MKLVITESQAAKLNEQLLQNTKNWAGNQLMKGGKKFLKSPTGEKTIQKVGDIAQQSAMDDMSNIKFSPETEKAFGQLDMEKDAPALAKVMAKLGAMRSGKSAADSFSDPSAMTLKPGETLHTTPEGKTTHTTPDGKTVVMSPSKVKVPKNLSVIELGRYMMHPLGAKADIASGFGPRDVKVGSKNHKGVDISAESGTPLYSPLDGVVTKSLDTTDDPCGGHIRINHGQLQTKYCHLSKMIVAKGSKVKRGQLIGYTGGGKNDPHPGRSTGPHLHYEILDANDVALNPVFIEPNLA